MKTTLIMLTTLLTLIGQAQTKKIAHKSHSGSENSFIAANYMDNLGDPPIFYVDSILKITDTTALQFCSRYRGGGYTKTDTIKYYKDFFETDSVKLISDTIAVKFSSGHLTKQKKTDTIISNKNNLKHVILREETYNPYVKKNYKNVEFVGFEDSVKNEIVPILNNYKSPKNNSYNIRALHIFIYSTSFLMLISLSGFFMFVKKKNHV